MTKNLYVVSTPFHLLSASIIALDREQDDNFLALVHPHGYEQWNMSCVLKKLCSENFIFKKIFPLINWMKTGSGGILTYKKQGEYLKSELGSLKIDNIFLGSDMDTQNQLLVAALEKNFYYRLDDGIYSYYNEDRKRPFIHRIFHKYKLHLLAMLMGINPNFQFNGDVLGEGKSGKGDWLYRPDLLKRFSPNVFKINSSMIDRFKSYLRKNDLLKQEFFEGGFVLYLSQPTVEQGRITIDKEFLVIEKVMERLTINERLIYKPHPKDKAYKMELLKKKFPDIIIIDSKEPVEIILSKEPLISTVVSYASTTLILANMFSDVDVKCICLLKTLEKSIGDAYEKIFMESGCEFFNLKSK